MKVLWASVFVGGVVAANWAASQYGLIGVGWGLLVPAGTLFAGLVLVARDLLHRAAGLSWVFASIAVGATVSVGMGLVTGSPVPGISAVSIAIASGVAFSLSELADTGVYGPLWERWPVVAMLLSNTVGAAVDTLLFLWLSGFGVSASAFWGQMLAKAVWVSIPAVVAIWVFDRWRERREVARCAT
jgi:queuosine precursor transporter